MSKIKETQDSILNFLNEAACHLGLIIDGVDIPPVTAKESFDEDYHSLGFFSLHERINAAYEVIEKATAELGRLRRLVREKQRSEPNKELESIKIRAEQNALVTCLNLAVYNAEKDIGIFPGMEFKRGQIRLIRDLLITALERVGRLEQVVEMAAQEVTVSEDSPNLSEDA